MPEGSFVGIMRSMKSMTGIGTAEVRLPRYELQVSLKSVNGRFLETRFHIPKEFHLYEIDLRKQIEKKLSRGTVDVFISRRGQISRSRVDIRFDADVAKSWVATHKKMSDLLKSKTELTANQLLALPQVVEIQEQTGSATKEKSLLSQTFSKALLNLEKAREQEGRFLKTELSKLFAQLEKLVLQMRDKREDANAALRKRMNAKLETMGFDNKVIEQRLAQEIVIQVDKSDISEELSRLHEHVKACLKLLKSAGAEGKRLEFYNQELLREVNTIGSKSQVTDLTALVVDAKTVIERIREQVQNLE